MPITITEGLAEIKLITKKIASKKEYIGSNLVRIEGTKDPLGDGRLEIAKEVQSINDLYTRIVMIREAIAKANLQNTIAINGQTMTINSWLAFKREAGPHLTTFYKELYKNININQQNNVVRPQVTKDDNGNVKLVNYIYNYDLKAANDNAVSYQDIMDKLDGQLSLKNATVTIEI